MRAPLVFHLTKGLLPTQRRSSLTYGVRTACAHFTPVVGGVLADRHLGKRRAVVIGASVMAAGHFRMALDPLFHVALATIALGDGLFLPSRIDDLHAADDPRRGGLTPFGEEVAREPDRLDIPRMAGRISASPSARPPRSPGGTARVPGPASRCDRRRSTSSASRAATMSGSAPIPTAWATRCPRGRRPCEGQAWAADGG